MPHAAPDDAREQIDSLHQGIVVALHRRLSDPAEGRGEPFRFREAPVDREPPRDETSLSRSIERALNKVTSMQAFIDAHEETIHDLRRADEAHARRQSESRELLEDSECRCRQEAERAVRAERRVELLEQRNAELERNYGALARKVEGLLRAIGSS